MRNCIVLFILAFAMPSTAHAQFYDRDCTPEYAQHIVGRYISREQDSEMWVLNLYQTCQSLIQQYGVGEPRFYGALNVLQPHANAVASGVDNRPAPAPPPIVDYGGTGAGSGYDGPPACPPGQTMILGLCH